MIRDDISADISCDACDASQAISSGRTQVKTTDIRTCFADLRGKQSAYLIIGGEFVGMKELLQLSESLLQQVLVNVIHGMQLKEVKIALLCVSTNPGKRISIWG